MGKYPKAVGQPLMSFARVLMTSCVQTLSQNRYRRFGIQGFHGAEEVIHRCWPDTICEVHDATNAAFVLE
jgi:hypothetical protein